MTQEPLERRVRTVEEAIVYFAETQRTMAENIILLTQTQSTLTDTVVELKQSRDELRQEQLEYKQRQQENDQRFYTLLQEIRHLSRRMDGQEQGERSP